MGGLVLASGFILFFNLWSRSLENHDYLRYAEVAREMIRSGEWVVPHLNGEIYVDKPPLTFWLIAIPSSLYGSVTPLFARLPSALSAWIGVIILFLWGKRIHGTALSGLISGGILLSCYQYLSQARLAKTDMLLCLFILLSFYFFYLGYGESGKKRYLFHGFSFFSMGLGVLTKGPFGMIPFLILSLFLIKERRWGMLISKPFILGYSILALTVLPWVLLFIERVGFDRSLTLVKESHALSRHAPFYFYFGQIWVQFFPWSLLIPSLFFYLWKERGRVWHSRESLFILWFVVLFVLFTLFKIRASRYLLPALPALALMISGMWRKKVSYFLIPSLLFVLVWHSVEINWIRKNLSYSPGMVLAGELRPLLKESPLYGYRLDVSTIEEVNFYLDRTIPLIEKTGNLIERGLVLMPGEVYEKIRNRGSDPLLFVQEFNYKRGKLVLVSKE